ncbi:centromere protein O [Aplochiton taeniatus]
MQDCRAVNEADAHHARSLQKRLNRVEKDGPYDEEEILDGTENSQLLLLMARHTQLKDLLNAHHLTGGYDLIETRKGVCLSLATSFEGIYLDTYNLEIDLAPLLKICRHNIPLSIPVESLAVQSNMQSDVKAFLDTLSQHLNAYAGRKQQLALVKELHETVQVMESNKLYTILVLLFSLPGDTSTAFLCTLDYADPTQCLPTRVIFESNGTELGLGK